MSFKKNILNYALYSGLSIYLEFLIGMLISILIARQLGADELGVYSVLLWFATLGITLANGGLQTGAIKFLAETRGKKEFKENRAVLQYVVRLQLIFLPVALLVSALVAYFMLGRVIEEQYAWLLIAFVAAIAPRALQIFYTSIIKGYESFRSIFLINMVVTPLNLLMVLVVMFLDGGIDDFVIVYLVTSALYFFAAFYWTRKVTEKEWRSYPDHSIRDSQKLSPEYVSRISLFVKIATFNTFLVFVVDRGIEVVFLSWYATAADAGIFSIAYRLSRTIMAMLPGIFGFFLLPVMARSLSGGKEVLAHRFRESGRGLVLMSSPFIAFGVVFSDVIIETMYGSELKAAATPFKYLLLFFGFTMLNGLSTSILLTMDKQSVLLKILVLSSLVNIVLDVILIQYFALNGAVAACIVTKVVFTVACQMAASSMLNTRLPLFEYAKIMILSYFLLVPLYGLYALIGGLWVVLLGGIVFILSYFFLTMYLFKLSRDEVSILQTYSEKVPVLRHIFNNKMFLWIDSRYAERFG